MTWTHAFFLINEAYSILPHKTNQLFLFQVNKMINAVTIIYSHNIQLFRQVSNDIFTDKMIQTKYNDKSGRESMNFIPKG